MDLSIILPILFKFGYYPSQLFIAGCTISNHRMSFSLFVAIDYLIYNMHFAMKLADILYMLLLKWISIGIKLSVFLEFRVLYC